MSVPCNLNFFSLHRFYRHYGSWTINYYRYEIVQTYAFPAPDILYGEWVEDGDNSYVFDYYCFYSDGTGIHGSYEADIDWVNEDDDIEWYTVDDEYLYIDGARYEYSCDGTSLEIQMNGRTRYYYEK